MTSLNKKIVLITGASSGIGLSTAKKLISLGYTVYGAARRVELLKQIDEAGGHSLFLDLTSDSSIQSCVSEILQKEGKIDILINNAGYGLGGPLETISISDAKNQFEVNLFGLARITQLVLPSMRKNRSGRIINISSIAGKFSSPYLGWYHATKFAVEAYSDALRMEVSKFGIKVSIVEPGLIQTDWGFIAEKNIVKHSENSDYEEDGKKVADFYKKYYDGQKASDSCVVTKAIVKSVTASKPKIRYKVGKYSSLFTLTARFSPDRLLDFLIHSIFNI